MAFFWKRRREPVEELLVANRPVPRDEYVAETVARLTSERRQQGVQGLRGRLVLAGAVTVLAAGAAIAAGAVGSVSSGAGSLASVARRAVTPASPAPQASKPVVINLTPTPAPRTSPAGGAGTQSSTGNTAQAGAGSKTGTGTQSTNGAAQESTGSETGTGTQTTGGDSSSTVSAAPSIASALAQSSSPGGTGQNSAPQFELNGVLYRTTADHQHETSADDEYYVCVEDGTWKSYMSPSWAGWFVNHVSDATYCGESD